MSHLAAGRTKAGQKFMPNNFLIWCPHFNVSTRSIIQRHAKAWTPNCRGYSFAAVLLILFFAILISTGHSETPANYVDYSMAHDGDAARGKVLFQNERVACAKCHTVDGSGGHAGPDLAHIGDKFGRRELIRAVLEPSAEIAVGYETTLIETKDGEEYQGVIKQVGNDWVALMNADGKLTRFENRNIKQRSTGKLSLMPEGLQASLSPEQFADLIAYLETLRKPRDTTDAQRGMPAMIPQASKAANFQSFFTSNVVFKAPLWFGQEPGTSNLFIVMEHGGMMYTVEKNASGDAKAPLLDLSHVIFWSPACGLLGMAFHPHFAENHRYFLQYQVEHNGKISTQIVGRRLSPDGRRDMGESNLVLSIPAATDAHNGGCIAFGPDGFLYIAMGDTGPQRDPEGHAQNLGLITGKMLRIDVDKPDAGRGYGIPKDNPFVKQAGARPEVWALGLREPWRFSFDPLTGDLWLGDVGQDTYEEVDIVRAGENYGWNVYEGFIPFSNQYRRANAQFTMPVFSYPHSTGVSITGGHVYRGTNAPQMWGYYICADFQVQKVWALMQANRQLVSVVEIGRAPSRISSIGKDAAGELYFVGYDSGLIYHADLSGVDPAPRP